MSHENRTSKPSLSLVPAQSDAVSAAATHLEFIKAIADLVQTLDEHGSSEAVGMLQPGTLEMAMYLIRHHANAAGEITMGLEEELEGPRPEVAE